MGDFGAFADADQYLLDETVRHVTRGKKAWIRGGAFAVNYDPSQAISHPHIRHWLGIGSKP